MRTFSRWMPPRQQLSRQAAIAVIATLLALGTWLAVAVPLLAAIIVAFLGVCYLLDRRRTRPLLRLRRERAHEGLCTFVRAFPRTERDPHILRGLYEEIGPYVTARGMRVPIRPTDLLVEDLLLDGDTLDEIADTVAERAGRDMATAQSNPLFRQVRTVADLVAFLRGQPRVAA